MLSNTNAKWRTAQNKPTRPKITPPPFALSPKETTVDELKPEQVHAMCNYLRGDCHKCPQEIDTAYGRGQQGCYAIALKTLEKAQAMLSRGDTHTANALKLAITSAEMHNPLSDADIQAMRMAVELLSRGDAWMPIESAPMDGTDLLCWRKDCGPFMAKYGALQEFMSEH